MKRLPDGRTAIVVLLAVLFFFLPAIYVLSVGPAFWLVHHEALSGETFRAVYYPLFEVSKLSRASNRLLLQYLQFWYADPFWAPVP